MLLIKIIMRQIPILEPILMTKKILSKNLMTWHTDTYGTVPRNVHVLVDCYWFLQLHPPPTQKIKLSLKEGVIYTWSWYGLPCLMRRLTSWAVCCMKWTFSSIVPCMISSRPSSSGSCPTKFSIEPATEDSTVRACEPHQPGLWTSSRFLRIRI